jgi:signal transduction histidine kinase/CheY-like chemotaxis protein
VLLVLIPLAEIDTPTRSGIFTAVPVVGGFVLALHPLWAPGHVTGIVTSILITVLGGALALLPWERIPRYLHAVTPIGWLAVAFGLEVQFGLSIVRSFPFILLPLIFLALYYSTYEFVIGAVLAVADLVLVPFINPASGDPAAAVLEALLLVALGIIVRRVVLQLERNRTAASVAESERTDLLTDLAQRNQELQELTRLKSEFLATMSHEIRTPLSGVIGMTGLLMDTKLTPEQREYVETIRASGDSLLEIINDILDFSRIEAGRVRLENLEFGVRYVTEEAVELFADAAVNKGLELIMDSEPDVPEVVIGDPGRLRQVLINLIGNAIKFTDSGEVIVRTRRDESKGPGISIRFEISDTGIGMSDAEQARVFAVYSQADSSTTRRHGGTGLGLAIARMLTQLMGGEMGVASTKGKGSTFWFTALFRESLTKARLSEASASLAGTSVAIIDDNRTNRTILERYVSSWGMRGRAFDSGHEALNEMRRTAPGNEPFDVAIVDLMMPGLDGIAVAKQVRADESMRDMKVILLTSAGKSETQVEGIDAELVKPVRPSQLFDALQTVLSDRLGRSVHQEHEDALRPADPSARRARILIADDNATNQKVAVRMLQRLGYRGDVASTGAEAVSMLNSGHYDAVLMDCQMPEVDGYEAARQIRHNERGGRRVPIIAMTADAMPGERERCLAAGMDDYISKPVKLHVVAAVLERWLATKEVV